MIDKLLQLYRMDKTGEGESNKLVIVLRTVELGMIAYFLVCTIYFVCCGQYSTSFNVALAGLGFLIMLFLSYRVSVRTQIICTNAVALICVVSSFLVLGAGTLVRNYFIALVVLCFFSGYGNYKIKWVYTVFLCIVHMVLQMYSANIQPNAALTESNYQFLQIMNIVFQFFCVAVVCFVYSNDSQHLEGKLIEYNNLLKKQASTDPLTGLCNRRSAMDEMDRLIAEKSENGFCVCMCDIDYFKKVNDSYGHDIGDNVLRGVASLMLEGLPKNCVISRWGGEEFLVIFPNMNGDDAKMILDIMRAKVKKLVFEVGPEKSFSITITYGLAEYGYSGSVEDLVKSADEKLYYGKEHGRDQVVF